MDGVASYCSKFDVLFEWLKVGTVFVEQRTGPQHVIFLLVIHLFMKFTIKLDLSHNGQVYIIEEYGHVK